MTKVLLAIKDTSIRCAWLPILVFGAHVLSSNVLNAYEAWPALDVPMHLAGGFAIIYFFHHALNAFENHQLLQPSTGLLRIILIFALACTATIFWEFAEYVSDHTIGTNAQGGLEDTLFDMLLGMIGAVIYLPFAKT